MKDETAIIIGAGPAGLTAAYELINRSGIKPVVFETRDCVGGLSATVDYKGNRIDAGGHRFVSESERVLMWWRNILPVEGDGINPEHTDRVLLIRNRVSRIFYLKKFFGYPVSLNLKTMSNLGMRRMVKILSSYAKARLHPIKEEKNLEDFFINKFGMELYARFFRDYSNKLWGVPCTMVKPDWGSQRIRGLSLSRTVRDTLKRALPHSPGHNAGISQFGSFLYPKYGPGQMWREVADSVREKGGEIRLNQTVVGIKSEGGRVSGVVVKDSETGELKTAVADYYLSSMPIRELIKSWEGEVPPDVLKAAESLVYRDLITVVLVLDGLKVKGADNGLIPDNWIYVQERGMRVGRIQVYNNWSPYLVKDRGKVLIGLEYFCSEGDELWSTDDSKLVELAVEEGCEMAFIERERVLDSAVIRTRKAYPAYFGGYDRLGVIKDFTGGYGNLFLIGRNGMHSYHNMDFSMLTAMTAVDNIINARKDRSNIWAVNAEHGYVGD